MAKSTKGMDKLKAMMMGGSMPGSPMMNAPGKTKAPVVKAKPKVKPVAKKKGGKK